MGSLKNIAVLISGSGTVCHAINNSCNEGVLKDVAKVALVVATTPGDHPFHILGDRKPAYLYLPWEDSDRWHRVMYDLMELLEIDLICLAGFIKKLQVWPEWKDKILNTHPSLLPKYGGKGMYGDEVHKAVLESGDEVTGCTVHVVNSEYDEGRILAQREMRISDIPNYKAVPSYILGNWVRQLEYELYPKAICDYLKEQYPKP